MSKKNEVIEEELPEVAFAKEVSELGDKYELPYIFATKGEGGVSTVQDGVAYDKASLVFYIQATVTLKIQRDSEEQ